MSANVFSTRLLFASFIIGAAIGCTDGPNGKVRNINPEALAATSLDKAFPDRGPVAFQVADFASLASDAPPKKRLAQAIARIRKAISALRENDRKIMADQMEERLRLLLETPPKSTEPRLHAIGFNSGKEVRRGRIEHQTAAVHVTDTDAPVVLCLSGYNEIEWTVTAAEGVDLQKIILVGYGIQQVVEKPEGVPVLGRYKDDESSKRFKFCAAYRESAWLTAAHKLFALTGMRLQTHYGQAYCTVDQAIVGPERDGWYEELATLRLANLLREAAFVFAATDSSDIAQAVRPVVFASYRGPGESEGAGSGYTDVSIAAGTIFGPFVETMQPTDRSVRQVLLHPILGILSIAGGELVRIDPESGQTFPYEVEGISSLHSETPMALDADNNRLYLWTNGLISIDLQTWAITEHRPDNPSVRCLAWCGEANRLYAVCDSQGAERGYCELRSYNRRGAEVSRLDLSNRIAGGLQGRPHIFCEHGKLIVTCYRKQEMRNIVIDAKTGLMEFICRHVPRS